MRRRCFKASKVPNGVYIQSVDGKLYTVANWSQSSSNANAVAVVTDNCRFIIAKTNYTTSTHWSETPSIVSNVLVSTSATTAKTDYKGKSNTDYILAAFGSNAPSAYYCSIFTFPNGQHGFLPALGELYAAYQNSTAINTALAKIGGDSLGSDVNWSSTQYNNEIAWYLRWSSGAVDGYYKYQKATGYNGLSTRVFGELNT